jgi:hypothetical protein
MFIFPLTGTDWNKIINIRVQKKLPQEALYNCSPREKTWPNISPLPIAIFYFSSRLKKKIH